MLKYGTMYLCIMPARKIKTLKKELGHRAHREHRSKRGRVPRGKQERAKILNYRRQKSLIVEIEHEQEINIYI